MRTLHADDRLYNALSQEMARVDDLRVKLKRTDLFPEFMMRRAILRARFAILQRNSPEARHLLKLLAQFTNDARP
jgi:hypothetical protein